MSEQVKVPECYDHACGSLWTRRPMSLCIDGLGNREVWAGERLVTVAELESLIAWLRQVGEYAPQPKPKWYVQGQDRTRRVFRCEEEPSLCWTWTDSDGNRFVGYNREGCPAEELAKAQAWQQVGVWPETDENQVTGKGDVG